MRLSEAFDFISRETPPTATQRRQEYSRHYDFYTLYRLRRLYRASQGLSEDEFHASEETDPPPAPSDRWRTDLGDDIRRLRDLYEAPLPMD